MRLSTTLTVTLLWAAVAGASAQTVYRCGNSYSQAPCPNGVALDVADPRTPAQRAEAQAAAERDAKAADALEKTRVTEENRLAAARAREARAAAAAQAAADRKAQREAAANRIPVYPSTYSPPYVVPKPFPMKKVAKKPADKPVQPVKP